MVIECAEMAEFLIITSKDQNTYYDARHYPSGPK